MDWLLATPQLHSAFSALGSLEGDSYIVSPNALAILEEINYKLTYEDQTLRTFRRAIGFGQNIRTDLIPLLENAKDEAVLDAVIRILVNLTVPVECLFSVEVMYRTEVGRHTIFELNNLLFMSKEAFTDPKSTKSVVEYMKHILESDTKLSLQKCDQINNCLLLLRNILHIPENNVKFIVQANANGVHTISMQNSILWNLFIQSIDKLLLYLMTCPQRAFWGVTMVQLIALMYKDQHVSTLQKLLNSWFEASLSESSEDNESNTSPPKQGSGDSSPMLTSDPTSDSSDNGSNSKNVSSEDRRQALREETEATLQEVSRKGQEYREFQEYQNSIMRVPIPENSSESNSTLPDDYEYISARAAVKIEGYKSPEMPTIEDEDEEDEEEEECNCDVTISAPIDIKPTNPVHEKSQKRKFKQPANNSSHTTKQKLSNDETRVNGFMPPPAVPVKTSAVPRIVDMDPVLSDSPPQPHQKVPHTGQLSLSKGKSCPQKRECPSSQSELSDCGYGTQVENQESISTSSNDDDGPQGKPQHQKPPCNSKSRNKQRVVLTMIDKKELRRKKLVRRSKSSLINMKGLVQHTPTDDDISNILKEFTVDFLLKGYGLLVEDLHKQLLTNMKIPIDTSHFFWLVTYFLKFAAQLELDMEHINTILTYDIISYLTYEGITLCEQLELNSRQEGSDLKSYLRRMHLVVTAIREFLQAIETYKKVVHLSDDDREHLRRLQIQISTTEDLRSLFVLLLRRYNPNLHTKQYLQDLIVTNHIFLLILDGVTRTEECINIKMLDHISQFATMEVMHHYGMLLEDFNNNGEFVNDCIFTMMHHVGGDLGQISTLFQPVILKTYSRIWEADYELCDDWSDLIEYVIHKFMNTPQKNALTLPTTSLTELTKEHNLENAVCTWTQEEMDTLYWYYVQSKKDVDVVGKILKLFKNNGNKQKSRISIINQLLQQDIITLVEYDDLMKFEDAEYQRTLLKTPTSCTTESGVELKSSGAFDKPSDDIQILRDFILKENKERHLIWLQKLLLECCYIKLILKKCPLREDHQGLDFIMEPVAYHSIMKNKSIPVVQWNNDQAATMLYQPFVLLLHKLGFQLPADAGSVFARIPDYWTAETMFNLAKKLGSLDKLWLKFDTLELEEITTSCYHITAARASLSSISSFEADITESEHIATASSNSGMLSPVAEIEIKSEKTNEIFAIPKAKHCHSIIRFTPDPSPMPPLPNWLQLVMRSKCNTAVNQQLSTSVTPQIATSSTMLATNQRIETNVSMLHSSNDPMTLTSTATVTETTAMLQHLTTVTSTISATLKTTVEAAAAVASAIATSTKVTKQNEQQATATTAKNTATLSSCPNIIGLNDEQHNKQTSNKSYSNDFSGNETSQSSGVPPSSLLSTSSSMTSPIALEFHKVQHQNVSDDDSAMKSLERNDSTSSSFLTRTGYSANMESEFSAMVAAVYQNDIANSDTASVTSDLTRMYVSDEDERHELQVSHFL